MLKHETFSCVFFDHQKILRNERYKMEKELKLSNKIVLGENEI